MAESESWGPAEYVVDAALERVVEAIFDAAVGLEVDTPATRSSVAREVTQALKQAGLLDQSHWGRAYDGVHPCRCSLGKDHATGITTEEKRAAVRR
jgi:hypothetical protein